MLLEKEQVRQSIYSSMCDIRLFTDSHPLAHLCWRLPSHSNQSLGAPWTLQSKWMHREIDVISCTAQRICPWVCLANAYIDISGYILQYETSSVSHSKMPMIMLYKTMMFYHLDWQQCCYVSPRSLIQEPAWTLLDPLLLHWSHSTSRTTG